MRRIRVGVSSCLLGNEVRYDGGHKHDETVARMAGQFELVAVCPEQELGLGVPREPIQLVARAVGGAAAATPDLIGVVSQHDHTARMTAFALRRVDELEALDICGYVFKKDSPSCGVRGVRVWQGDDFSREGVGVFARVLMERLPDLPVEEEDRLADPATYQDFCLRVVARAVAVRSRRPGGH